MMVEGFTHSKEDISELICICDKRMQANVVKYRLYNAIYAIAFFVEFASILMSSFIITSMADKMSERTSVSSLFFELLIFFVVIIIGMLLVLLAFKSLVFL